jgi:hypothetical protein
MPPPTWNDASEMPKNSMMRRPASALTAMTTKAPIAATRIVRRRCSRTETACEMDEERNHADRIDDRQQREQRLQDFHRQTGAAVRSSAFGRGLSSASVRR